jgi:hypothetical protein
MALPPISAWVFRLPLERSKSSDELDARKAAQTLLELYAHPQAEQKRDEERKPRVRFRVTEHWAIYLTRYSGQRREAPRSPEDLGVWLLPAGSAPHTLLMQSGKLSRISASVKTSSWEQAAWSPSMFRPTASWREILQEFCVISTNPWKLQSEHFS